MQLVGQGSNYEWNAPLKSLDDLDDMCPPNTSAEATRADGQTVTQRTLSRTDADDRTPLPTRWAARLRTLDGRAAALAGVMADARRRGEGGPAFVALRRLTGCLGAICDALHHSVDRASTGPVGLAVERYVECALWWMTQLVGSLEEALARRIARESDAAVIAASEFAVLYALGHLGPMRDACGERSSIDGLHREVTWFATSLHEEIASD